MFPGSIPHFSIGPLCGLIANGMLAILCLVIFALYRHYKPLCILTVFYIFIALAFLGWVIYGLQKSPRSILLGNRILYASIAVLPATWFWFYLSFFRQRPARLTWVVTGLSLILGFLALLGKGPMLFGLPLEPDRISPAILRPLSQIQISAFLKLYRHIAETVDIKNLERISEESSHSLEIHYKMDDISLFYLLRNCRNIFKGKEYPDIEEFIYRHKDDGVLLLKARFKIQITERAKAKKETASTVVPAEVKKAIKKE